MSNRKKEENSNNNRLPALSTIIFAFLVSMNLAHGAGTGCYLICINGTDPDLICIEDCPLRPPQEDKTIEKEPITTDPIQEKPIKKDPVYDPVYDPIQTDPISDPIIIYPPTEPELIIGPGYLEKRCLGNEIWYRDIVTGQWIDPVPAGDCSKKDSLTGCIYWKCEESGSNSTNKIAYRRIGSGVCRERASGPKCEVQEGQQKCEGKEYEVHCAYGCRPIGSTNANCLPKAIITTNPSTNDLNYLIVPEFTSVQLHCNDSIDPDGSIETCNWTFSDKNENIITTSSQKQTSYTTQEDLTIVELEACDNKGACDKDYLLIIGIVKPQPTKQNGTKTTFAGHSPPVACMTIKPEEQVGVPGKKFTFDASCSYDPEPGDFITSYLWIFGDGTTKTGQTITHSYPDDGHYYKIYDITLIVTDNGGPDGTKEKLYGIKTTSILISKELPKITIQATPQHGITPLHSIFQIKEQQEYNFKEFIWNFGDGTEKTGSFEEKHTFNQPGKYTAYVLAKDANNNIAIGKTNINAYKFIGISELTATDTELGEQTKIFIQCTGTNTAKLFIEHENTITTMEAQCNIEILYIPRNDGLYTLTASIPDCDTIECTQTTSFQAKPGPIQIRTSETWIVAIITLLSALIIARKRH